MFWYASSVGANIKLPTCESSQDSIVQHFCVYDNDWGAEMPVNLPFDNNVTINNTIYHNNNYFKQEEFDKFISPFWSDYDKEFVLIYALHGSSGSEYAYYRIGNTQEVLTINDLKNANMSKDISTTLDILFVGKKIADQLGRSHDEIKYSIKPLFVSKELADSVKSGYEIDPMKDSLGLFGVAMNNFELTKYSISVDSRSRCLLYNGDVIRGFDFEQCDLQVTLYNAAVPNASDPQGVPGTSDGTCSVPSVSPLSGYFNPCSIYRNGNNQVPIRIELNAYKWKKVPGGFERGEPVILPNTLAPYLNFTFEVKNNSTKPDTGYNLPNIAKKVKFGDRRNMYTLGSAYGCQNGIENLIPKYEQTKSHEALGVIKYVTADKEFDSLESPYPIAITIKSVTIGSQTLSLENYENSGIVKLGLIKDGQLKTDGSSQLIDGKIQSDDNLLTRVKTFQDDDSVIDGFLYVSRFFFADIYRFEQTDDTRYTPEEKMCYAQIELKAIKNLQLKYADDYNKPDNIFSHDDYVMTKSYNTPLSFRPDGDETNYNYPGGLQSILGINSGIFSALWVTIDKATTRQDEYATVWVDKEPKIERTKRIIYTGTFRDSQLGSYPKNFVDLPQRIVVTNQFGSKYQRIIVLGKRTPSDNVYYYQMTDDATGYRVW